MEKKLVCLIVFLLLMFHSATAYFVGVSPGVKNHGTLERGTTIESQIYIQTDRDDIQLDPNGVTPGPGFINLGKARQYGVRPDEFSAEDINGWISFREEEMYDERTTKNNAVADGEIPYFLEVPRDAEPGYHVIRVKLNPSVSGGGGGTINTKAVSNHIIIFKVPGNAEREVRVRNVEALRSGDSRVKLEAEVENTGTVTTRVVSQESESSVFTDSGQKIHDYTMGGKTIEPGETLRISRGWTNPNGDIKAGNYRTSGEINYITGKAYFEDSLSITDYIQIESADNESSGGGVIPSGGSGESPPIMLVLIGLVLSGSILYAFNIDPMLIIMALSVIAISTVITLTALPTALIGLVVILSAGLFYYGWM